MTLRAYFDESGTNPGDDAFVLAGYVSTHDKWLRFTEKWTGLVVDEWGLDFFHMADFESRFGPYADWDDGTRKERLNKLLQLIAEHATVSVAFSVPNKPFRKIFGELAKDDVRYLLLGARVFSECSKVDRFGRLITARPRPYLEERLAYVFEAGARGGGQVAKAFSKAYNIPEQRREYRLMSFELGGKEDFPPLQAADILAYELYKHWSRQFGNETRPKRYPLDKLAPVPHVWASLTDKALKGYKPIITQWLNKS